MKLKHRALTLLLTIAMLLTYMPAMAFAAPADYDDPESITFIPADGSLHYSGGRKSTDTIDDEETGQYESDPYIYYDGPDFVEGDKLDVTYGKVTVRYTYGIISDPEGYEMLGWEPETSGAPEINPRTSWVDMQNYENPFTGESEEFKVELLDENGEETVIATEASFQARLVYYGDPTNIEFTHEGEPYTVEGNMISEKYDETTGDWESVDPFVYYDVPYFEANDKVEVTFESGKTVNYEYKMIPYPEDPDDEYFDWVTEDKTAPSFNTGTEWVNDQYENHFEADSVENFVVYISFYTQNEEDPEGESIEKTVASDPIEASLTYDETQDYEVKDVDAEGTATYKHGARKLKVDYTKDEDSEEFCNFPQAGDSIVITEKGKAPKEYTYRGKEEVIDVYVFTCDDEELYLVWNVDCGELGLTMWTRNVDVTNKRVINKYYYATADVEIVSDIVSMKYEPSSVSVYSENIKVVDDGKTFYDFDNRYAYKDEDGDTHHSCYANGDKLTVKFKDPIGTKEYIARNGWLVNINDPEDELYIYPENTYLEPGNNTVKLWYHGCSASINVYMDTPALREARAKAARDAAKAAASNINKGTVSAADIKKASDLGATTVTFGASVKKIQKNAFKGTNITTVEVKTKKLKAKSVKGSLKGSKVKTIKVNIGTKKVNKQYVKKYKKIFTKKNAGKKAKVK